MLPARGWLWLPPLLLVAGCATATHPPRAAVLNLRPSRLLPPPRSGRDWPRVEPQGRDRAAPSPKTETGRAPSPKVEIGQASWYGHAHHGRLTASGEVFDMHDLTAAHRTLPMGSRVLVTNTTTGDAAEVRINDRGPFTDGRILDLSYGAARLLGAVHPGVIPVKHPGGRPARRVSHGPRDGRYTIQLGAFASRDRAEALRQDLAREGVAAVVTEVPARRHLLSRARGPLRGPGAGPRTPHEPRRPRPPGRHRRTLDPLAHPSDAVRPPALAA